MLHELSGHLNRAPKKINRKSHLYINKVTLELSPYLANRKDLTLPYHLVNDCHFLSSLEPLCCPMACTH